MPAPLARVQMVERQTVGNKASEHMEAKAHLRQSSGHGLAEKIVPLVPALAQSVLVALAGDVYKRQEEDCLLWAFDVLLIFGVCFHSVFLFWPSTN